MSQTYTVERPPRQQPELPEGEVEIPAPPEEKENPAQPLIQLALPLVTVIGYVLTAALGQGRNPVVLIPMGLSVFVSIAMALYLRQRQNRLRQEKGEAYAQQLVELRKKLSASQEVQRRHYLHNLPSPLEALQFVAAANQAAQSGQPASRLAGRLWERRPADSDFLALRLGVGAVPSSVPFIFKGDASSSQALARQAQRLAADSLVLTDTPVGLRLGHGSEDESAGPHAVGLVCPAIEAGRAYAANLLVHFVTLHAPSDARLYLLGLDQARPAWRWAGRLPHSEAARLQDTQCFEDQADRQAGRADSQTTAFLRGLRRLLEERRLRLEDSDGKQAITLPHLLLVVDLLDSLPPDSALADLRSDPAMALLLRDGRRLGASVIFLVPHAGDVPDGCEAVIELIVNHGNYTFRYAEQGVNAPRFAGQPDPPTDPQALANFSAQLQPLKAPQSYGADLPRGVHLLDMLGVHTAEEIRARLKENWQRSTQPELAAWLTGPLGVMPGGDIRRLTFSAEADGVHGLIAGSTGSGKSELLMSMILGLAFMYDPSIVNFVLVDFKGGAAFEPLRKLPHVVDIVTNLHGNAVERMFAAIMAEIHRREAINVASGSKHIVHYRQNGLHLPPYGRDMVVRGQPYRTAPYPHLFIFIDEFAEMMAENPEYRAQLNSITRLGRALGVTLILAAQRPTGVTDQMRANIKFRIALRVETREESGEVLRRPDAAFLPTGIPGRGYLQVGNENLDLIQVAWSGADFTGGQAQTRPPVIWRGRPARKAAGAGEAPKVFEALVATMSELAGEVSLPQRKPWPDFLPDSLSLESPVDTSYLTPEGLEAMLANLPGREAGGAAPTSAPVNGKVSAWLAGAGSWPGIDWGNAAMRALVGVVDNPFEAEQFPLQVDLRRGHAVVYSASGWGKTTFLRTLVTSLAVSHSPGELHVYLLDFGNRQLAALRELPHLGALIYGDEEERVVRLLRMLDRMLEKRKAQLSDAGADDLYRYNQANPELILPAVLVVIDNFAGFREGFDGLMPMLTTLLRDGRAMGLHFAFSAEQPSVLSGRLASLFGERFALKLSDAGEYADIVGRGARAVEDIPGRGWVRAGRQALSFQAALPVGAAPASSDQDETQRLATLLRGLAQAAADLPPWPKPQAVNVLAARTLLSNLLAAGETVPERWPRAPLGLDDRTLLPWRYDAHNLGPHLILIAPPRGGKTTALRTLALSLAHSAPPETLGLVLIDFQQRLFRYGGRRQLSELPHVLAAVSQASDLEGLIAMLQAIAPTLAERGRALFVLIDNYDSFAEEARSVRTAMPALGALAREWGSDGLFFVLAGSPDAMRSAEELRKQAALARLGLALGSADLVSSLNGRVPRGLASAELPSGRGFVVKDGLVFMVQLATPYEDDERIAEGLDAWVERLAARYPPRSEPWAVVAAPEPPAEAQAPAAPAPKSAPTPNAPAPAKADGKHDIEALKPRLLEQGLSPDVMALLSPQDLIDLAVSMKLIETEG